jgi:hypothetical protein
MRAPTEISETVKQSQFVCSACGAGRDCDCAAPALARLAAKNEQDRQRAKAYRERKAEEKQQPRHVTNDDDKTLRSWFEDQTVQRHEERLALRAMCWRAFQVGFKELAKTLHPDKGGTTEAFQLLGKAKELMRRNFSDE